MSVRTLVMDKPLADRRQARKVQPLPPLPATVIGGHAEPSEYDDKDNLALGEVHWSPGAHMRFTVCKTVAGGEAYKIRHGWGNQAVDVVVFEEGVTYAQVDMMREVLANVAHDVYGTAYARAYDRAYNDGFLDGWADKQAEKDEELLGEIAESIEG